MYGNTINMSGDTKAVQVGTDGVASNTIPQFDFRENRIVYAAGCYEHALLLGGGVTTALILNNYIYMPANANSLALGIVVKTIPATLGLVKIYGNYVYAPRPIYLKGASKNDIKYNSCICNQTGYAPFEYANVLSGSSYLSSLNNIENNNLIGLEYGIILYDGGASEEENITIKTCTFKDNKFYFTTYYLKDVAINYTWANRATFWASTNEVDSVLLLESNLPIRLP